MVMKISHDSILQTLYASTALATLHPDHRATLLHPDHAPALKALIPDAVGILVARCNSYSFSVNFAADDFEIESVNPALNSAFCAAVVPAIAAIIVYIVRLAACENPPFPSAPLDTLNNCATPTTYPSRRLRPYRIA